MKKVIFSMSFSLMAACLYGQVQDRVYYYYGSEKIYLKKESNVKFIYYAKEPAAQINQLRSQSMQVDTLSDLMYRVSGDFSQKSVRNLFSEQRDSNICYVSDMLLYEGHPVWESDEIMVKVFSETNIEEVLKANYMPYKEYKRIGSNPQNYLLTLDVSKTPQA